ncbi:MAG TPA: LEPR-XLL domain-containing protein, partial [Roseateles sp.]
MKLRSLLPRRWRAAPPAVPLAVKPSDRAWSLEALEPRMLLSADPVLGAVHVAMAPDHGAQFDALAQAYSAGPTMHALSVTLPNGGVTSPIIGASYDLNNDSLQVSGNLSIQATAGNIRIGGAGHGDFLSGNSTATTDNLTLSATGNITINAEVNTAGGSTDLLSSLTVLAAQNVSFKEAVNIKGTVEIHASGTVTFDKPVTLSEGGSLKIYGASAIYFATTSRLDLTVPNGGTPGDLVLQADTLTLLTPSNRISGTGTATIMPTTAGYGMALFSAPGVHASTLTLDNTAMATFGTAFQSFSFGQQTGGHANANSGAVWLGGTTDSNPLAWDAVKI